MSVGITRNNVLGCNHVERGWSFDLETGCLLSQEELLSRMGVTPAEVKEAVRRELLAFVESGRDLILEECIHPDDFIAAHAEENYARLCEEIRDGVHDPEAPALYVTDTGELHLSVWDPSNQYYYDSGDGDWTEELAPRFPQSAG